jgi:hypothetical protein
LFDSFPHSVDKIEQSRASLSISLIHILRTGFSMVSVLKHTDPQAFADLQLHPHSAPAPITDVTTVQASQTPELATLFREKRLKSDLPQFLRDTTAQHNVASTHEYEFFFLGTAMYRYDALASANDLHGFGFIKAGARDVKVFVRRLLQAL